MGFDFGDFVANTAIPIPGGSEILPDSTTDAINSAGSFLTGQTQARARRRAGRAARDEAVRRAARVEERGRQEAERSARVRRAAIGRQRAAFGASGVTTFGTPTAVDEQAFFDLALERRRILEGANQRARDIRAQGERALAAAKRAARQGQIDTGFRFLEFGTGLFTDPVGATFKFAGSFASDASEFDFSF